MTQVHQGRVGGALGRRGSFLSMELSLPLYLFCVGLSLLIIIAGVGSSLKIFIMIARSPSATTTRKL